MRITSRRGGPGLTHECLQEPLILGTRNRLGEEDGRPGFLSPASRRLGCFSTAGVGLGRILPPCLKWKGHRKDGTLGSGLSAQPQVCPLHLDSQGSQLSLHQQGAGGHKKKMATRTWGPRATATMTMTTTKRRKKRRPTRSRKAGTEVPDPAERPASCSAQSIPPTLTSCPEGKAEQATGDRAGSPHTGSLLRRAGGSFLHPELTLVSALLPSLPASSALGFTSSDPHVLSFFFRHRGTGSFERATG